MKNRRRTLIASVLSLVAMLCSAVELSAADEAPAPAAVKAPVSGPVSATVMTNAALQKVDYPQSFFKFQPGFGRDPFHPQSTRRTTPVATPEPASVPKPSPQESTAIIPEVLNPATGPVRELDPDDGTSFFVLKGVVATRSRRLVTLSTTVKSYIFQTGDEMMLRVPDGKMRVRCLEIRSRSAVFQLEGKREPVVFSLRDDL